jgi:hypothetical protein
LLKDNNQLSNQLRIKSKKKNKKSQSKQYPKPTIQSKNDSLSYALEFYPETDFSNQSFIKNYQHELALLAEYEKTEHSSVDSLISNNHDDSGNTGWTGEGYEKATKMDKTFKSFQKYIQIEPSQCIRYGYNQKPVFYSPDHIQRELVSNGPPACENCGGKRVFEMQLMPGIIPYLPTVHTSDPLPTNNPTSDNTVESEKDDHLRDRLANLVSDGMDFGTVLIYTCERDCESSEDLDYRREFAVSQHDKWPY